MNRRTLLGVCIASSIAVHALILVGMQFVLLLEDSPVFADALAVFKVDLVDDLPPLPDEDEADVGPGWTPDTLKELLERETQGLDPADSALSQPVEVPLLAERVASEPVEREHELSPDSAVLDAVDTKVIEISEAEARRDIEVARRLVTPSTNRIFDEGATPTLGGSTGDAGDEVILIEPVGTGGAGGGSEGLPGGTAPTEDSGAGEAGGQVPPREIGVLEPDTSPESGARKLELPKEQDVARLPVLDEIQKDSKYEFIDDLVEINVDAYVPPGEDRGFFRLRISPKEGEDIEVLPKGVTFVIDASNSISQRKLDQTVAGVRQTIQSLRPQDRFNIVVFRDTPTMFQPEMVEAIPEKRQEALAFLEDIECRGETDIYSAIEPVVMEAPTPGTPSIVLVASDGRPTTGIRNQRTIINNLTAENDQRNTIFAYGGGATVNRPLLDLLAYRNKGESYVSPQWREMAEELPEFFGQLEDPILVDCEADYGSIDEDGVFPKQIPDFYKAKAVTIYGQFDPKKDKKLVMRLTGQAGERQKEIVFKADLGEAATGLDEIAREWAFRKAYYLIGEMCRVGETPELRAALSALSQKYGIKTSYD